MDADQLMEESMDKLRKLPDKVAKHCTEIRQLDTTSETLSRELKIRMAAYVKSMKKATREQKLKNYHEIERLFKEVDKIAVKKIKLAGQLYDSVDADIAIVDKATQSLHACHELASTRISTLDRKKRKEKGRKSRNALMAEPPSYMPLPSVPLVEMPVDPNEPTYCICHQVSFGQMIMCDNDGCKTEWFHFQCVGLTEDPPGKWYCEACAPLVKEKKKKK